MNAKDYLINCISVGANNDLPRDKYKAVLAIIQRMLNKGLDPIDIFDEIRTLLDIEDRHGNSAKLNLYSLDTNTNQIYDEGHAVVLAKCDVEARVLASKYDDRFLEQGSCTIVNTNKSEVVLYYREC